MWFSEGFGHLSRPVAMEWRGVPNAAPGQQDDIFLPPLGIFLAIVYCCFIFVAAKEKCPEILVEPKSNLCDMLESSILSYIYIIHLIVVA